jgi:hypothetical protein
MLFLCGPAMAQSITGTIAGTVVGASGKALAGASVMLTNEKTTTARVGALVFGPNFGKIIQTNAAFGAPRDARSPRVMQGSLRINF